MTKIYAIACCGLLPLCLSCNAEPGDVLSEAQERAGVAREQVTAMAADAQIGTKLERLIAAVDERDFEQLKDACQAIDLHLGTRVLTKYHRAFALEIEEGPQSVIEYLTAEIEGCADSDAERSALVGLRRYFEAKGTTTTRDALVVVLLVALETKFPHGRGTIVLAPFLELPDNTTTANQGNGAHDESPTPADR